jgi:hypothetical protein
VHFRFDNRHSNCRDCAAVYSFLLEAGSESKAMVINGVEAITLAHGLSENKILEHPYFGSDRIIEDLQTMAGWQSGFVELLEGCAERDPISGLVVRLRQPSA